MLLKATVVCGSYRERLLELSNQALCREGHNPKTQHSPKKTSGPKTQAHPKDALMAAVHSSASDVDFAFNSFLPVLI